MNGIKSLHVWGEKDQVVPGAKSKLLYEWLKGDCRSFASGHAAPPVPWAETSLVDWIDSNNKNNVHCNNNKGEKMY